MCVCVDKNILNVYFNAMTQRAALVALAAPETDIEVASPGTLEVPRSYIYDAYLTYACVSYDIYYIYIYIILMFCAILM